MATKEKYTQPTPQLIYITVQELAQLAEYLRLNNDCTPKTK